MLGHWQTFRCGPWKDKTCKKLTSVEGVKWCQVVQASHMYFAMPSLQADLGLDSFWCWQLAHLVAILLAYGEPNTLVTMDIHGYRGETHVLRCLAGFFQSGNPASKCAFTTHSCTPPWSKRPATHPLLQTCIKSMGVQKLSSNFLLVWPHLVLPKGEVQRHHLHYAFKCIQSRKFKKKPQYFHIYRKNRAPPVSTLWASTLFAVRWKSKRGR